MTYYIKHMDDILDEIGRRTKPEFLKICADEEVHVDLEELKIDR